MDVDADVTPVADTAAAATGAVADDCTAVAAAAAAAWAAKIFRSRKVSTLPTLWMARPAPPSKPPTVVKVFMVLP